MWRYQATVLDRTQVPIKESIEQLAARASGTPGSAAASSAEPVDLVRVKHDVKNQLTSILCFCSLLRQSAVNLKPKEVDYVNRIQGSTKAILLLLNGFGASDDAAEAVQTQAALSGAD